MYANRSWTILPTGPWAQRAWAQGLQSWSCTQDGGACLHGSGSDNVTCLTQVPSLELAKTKVEAG